MNQPGYLQMVRTNRFELIYKRWKKRKLTQAEAGEQLEMSERTFRRYVVRYEEEGKQGLGDRRLGKASPWRASQEEVSSVVEMMIEAYQRTRKDGAVGIDGITAEDYERDLESNLEDLLNRIKSGEYFAPPVLRHYIPKADGTKRPLGIPTFEDKIAQRAILMMLEPMYEAEFSPCSYGFRSGRSAHDALGALDKVIRYMGQGWVIDADIKKYFDSIDHRQLREFLDLRIKDGVIRRMIDKWLKAGVLEEGNHKRSRTGTPQGGVISPLIANIYLHHVLDRWFEEAVKPRMRGRCQLVRYADDFVMTFEDSRDGERVLGVLGKRLGKYGLELHETKTRYVDMRGEEKGGDKGGKFDFLGFYPRMGTVKERKAGITPIHSQEPACASGERGKHLVQGESP